MNTTIDESAFAGGMLGAFLAIAGIAAIIFYVLTVIACWKVFEKAGEPGWKCLIPIYSQYIMFKIVGMKNLFWILFAVSVVVSIIVTAMGFDTQNIAKNSMTGTNLVAALMYMAMAIFALVISIMNYNRISKVFGHGIVFTLGLIFLPYVFLLVLGFDHSKYDKKLASSWSVEVK